MNPADLPDRVTQLLAEDPYRTSHPPEVKIDGRAAAQILHLLEQLILDARRDDNILYLTNLAECDQALRAAIERSKEPARSSERSSDLLPGFARDQALLLEHGQKITRAQRITAMAATIAAGLWARGEILRGLEESGIARIAELAHSTAETLLRLEDRDVR